MSWGAHSGIAEDSGILAYYSVSTEWTATDVSLGSGAFEPSDVANDLTAHIQKHTTLPLTNVSTTVCYTVLQVSTLSQRHSALSRLRRRKWNPDVNGSILIYTNLVLRLLALRPSAEITSLLNFCSPIFGLTPFGWLHYITPAPYFWWEHHIDVLLLHLLQLLSEPQLGRKTRPTCILNNQSQEEEKGWSSSMTIRLGELRTLNKEVRSTGWRRKIDPVLVRVVLAIKELRMSHCTWKVILLLLKNVSSRASQLPVRLP